MSSDMGDQQFQDPPPLISEPVPSPEMSPPDDVSLASSYLHPLSILFVLISQLKQNVIPAVFGVFGAAQGNLTLLVIAFLYFAFSVGAALVRYFTLRYSIRDGELTVQEGLLFRRIRKVPTRTIQNIDLVQNILHRMFGVAEVRVETASGTKPEAILRVLSLEQVEKLRERVDQASLNSPTLPQDLSQHADEPAIADDRSVEPELLLHISLMQLIKAGLASNRGLIIVGVLIGAASQFYRGDNNDWSKYDYSPFTSWLNTGSMITTVALAAGLALAALAFMRLLGVGWYVLRFFDYRLQQVGDDFKISCGLLTRLSATVPIGRVQFISVHRPLMMRWFGLASIRIETAGGAGTGREDATETISRRWFIPVINEAGVADMVHRLRPDTDWDEQTVKWQSLPPRAKTRKTRVVIFVCAIIAVIGGFAWPWWGALPGLLLMPLAVIRSRIRIGKVGYARRADGVAWKSGWLKRKTSLTFFDRVQTVQWQQSPFDRRWNLATLAVDTAAGGPADHRIEIGWMDAEFAAREYSEIRELSSRH